MSSETTMTARQYRFQKWAAQIMDFQSRLAGMNVVDWCACHGITKRIIITGFAVQGKPKEQRRNRSFFQSLE